MAAAEVAPFAKTGGLADVASALPRYLAGAGHDVRVFMPRYPRTSLPDQETFPVDFLEDAELAMGRVRLRYSVATTRLPGSDLYVYLIDCPELYGREAIYGEADDHLRFGFLTRASIECCQRMGWSPQIFHCNDWHTALLPLYLRTLYDWDELFRHTRTLLTIHNIAYQGVFPRSTLSQLGLEGQEGRFHQQDLAGGVVNFLKTGVLYADVVSTVSPTYANEIQGGELGMGLQDLLARRSDSLIGILNGVDYAEWNPETDAHLSDHYSRDDLGGKERNKEALLEELELEPVEGAPLLGVVSRLTAQKGFELLYEALPRALAARDLRFIALGSGAADYEGFFTELQRQFPGRVCYYRGFSEELAHRIEAASDIFLMPSRFEPCGLNQMYSLRYGTVPIVHKTGGLADSVEPWDWEEQSGTGFVFENFDAQGFAWALESALDTYDHQEAWARLVQNGMSRDFSWDRQGARYVDLYRRMVG